MKANWFITKGADLNRQKSGSSSTALHYLAHDVGKFLHLMESVPHVVFELHQLSPESKDLMRRILVDSICDDCCCVCSLSGCSGLTRLLSPLFQTRTHGNIKDPLSTLRIVVETVTPLLDPVAQE